MKFVTQKKHRFGKQIILPILGKVDVSKEGIIDVHEEFVEKFSKLRTSFEIVSDEETEEEKINRLAEEETQKKSLEQQLADKEAQDKLEQEAKELEEISDKNIEDSNHNKTNEETEKVDVKESDDSVNQEKQQILDKIAELEQRKLEVKKDSTKEKIQSEIDELSKKL